MSRRRALQTMGLAGLGVVGLTGCRFVGETQTVTSGQAPIEMWTHDPGYAEFFTQAAADEELVGGSPWDFDVNVTSVSADGVVTRLITQAVARRPLPDMAGLEIDQFARMLRSGIAENLLVDLTSLADQHGENLLRTEAYSSEGRVFAIESDNCISVMWYRQDLFEELGIPEDVETWEEMLEIGAEVAADGGYAIGMVSNSGTAVVQSFGQMLLQRGGSFYDAEGQLSVVSEEAVDALEMMAEGVRSGAFLSMGDPYGGATAAALGDDRLIAIVMPNWYEAYGLQANVPEQEGLWRARTIPRFSGGGHIASTIGGTAFGVVADQPLSDAAVDFLDRTYLSPEGQLARYHAGGYLPTLVDLYQTNEFLSIESEFLGGQRIFEVYGPAAEDLPPYYQSENSPQMREAFAGPLLNAIHGNVAPEDALQAAADSYHRQVDE
ncbi:ABC transporter substrate-binding protein [Nesterenkonia alba]|uniref:ABC transporter substrate-binding protein n=1 Tax=Nesterenkonia alba TaxID=515814 RepID=UPI000420E5FA|nr:ABC transporter substrate-binding protein [Nesterenkonia alba]